MPYIEGPMSLCCTEVDSQFQHLKVVMKTDRAYTELTHCGRVTQICLFNTVKLGTSASSP